MKWFLITALLLLSGCAADRTESHFSVFVEKDFWVEQRFEQTGTPDAKLRLEYRLVQQHPWPFLKR